MSGRAYSAIILAGGDGRRALYASLPSTDFSRTVLTPAASRLAVVPVTGVDWNDLGDPGRVVIARQRLDRQIALA